MFKPDVKRFFVFFLIYWLPVYFPPASASSTTGAGRVNMQGVILDTACAISVESREQTIAMGVVPLSEIIRNGQGQSKSFSIGLVNCLLEKTTTKNWNYFKIIFDGDDQEGLFGISGDASGVGLRITDVLGNIALPGKALPIGVITQKNMRLDYSLKLVANKKELKSGAYTSSIRFKLDYF
ncbi:fimbrial protein [Klebsiella aerogenes]